MADDRTVMLGLVGADESAPVGVVLVRVREVYGNRLTYPACETGRKLAAIAGQKTFTPVVLRLIRELGYEVRQVV